MPEMLTINETAQRLSCSRDTVERMIQRGDLGAVNLTPAAQRRTLRIPVEDIQRLTASHPS